MSPDPQTFIRTQLELKPVPDHQDLVIWQATPTSRLSQLYDDLEGEGPAPYWAYVWGGGVALSHYLEASPEAVRGKRVLDLGTGSGLVAICAARAGASNVIAVDIDPFAIAAVQTNVSENGVTVSTLCDDILDGRTPEVDVILVGDLFYEQVTAERLRSWLAKSRLKGIEVLVGDPGRQHLPTDDLELLAEFNGYDFANVDGEISRLSVYRLK